ncbi:MAG: coenzyme F420-0:L-glutamate ligase [Conexivisphaerales archaeon]
MHASISNKKEEDGVSVDPIVESLQIIPIKGIPDVKEGDDIAELIYSAQKKMNLISKDGDIYVIAQKVVSKAEGRLVKLSEVKPSRFAEQLAASIGKDAREVQLILDESRSIVKARLGILITETKHGIVCANSGIDMSNVNSKDNPHESALLLPVDPDQSAKTIRMGLEKRLGKRIAVIISDTFGRPWREGHVDFAIGVSGIECFRDYRGKKDMYGRELRVTLMAQVDELAAAAELVMGKARAIPAALIRGFRYRPAEGSASLIRPIERDLFR